MPVKSNKNPIPYIEDQIDHEIRAGIWDHLRERPSREVVFRCECGLYEMTAVYGYITEECPVCGNSYSLDDEGIVQKTRELALDFQPDIPSEILGEKDV